MFVVLGEKSQGVRALCNHRFATVKLLKLLVSSVQQIIGRVSGQRTRLIVSDFIGIDE